MTVRLAATLGAVFALLAVAAGAFGAHALRSRLEPRDLEIFETAVRYQMYHAFALFVAAALLQRGLPQAGTAAWAFVAGITLFAGSLYLMVFTGTRWLGAITPLGGVAFLAGWTLIALAARRL
ncbi:MAG: DUF423 domain-containing protein [Gemmatimonadales bacterium]|nr:DUF423 domain-containing protein [Gemmatimonadales bacterium]